MSSGTYVVRIVASTLPTGVYPTGQVQQTVAVTEYSVPPVNFGASYSAITIHGTTSEGQPVSGGEVRLVDAAGHVFTGALDADGNITLTGTAQLPLIAGTTTVTVTAADGNATTVSTTIGEGNVVQQSVVLTYELPPVTQPSPPVTEPSPPVTQPPPQTPPDGVLPATGATLATGYLALALVVLGGGLTVLARARRAQ